MCTLCFIFIDGQLELGPRLGLGSRSGLQVKWPRVRIPRGAKVCDEHENLYLSHEYDVFKYLLFITALYTKTCPQLMCLK